MNRRDLNRNRNNNRSRNNKKNYRFNRNNAAVLTFFMALLITASLFGFAMNARAEEKGAVREKMITTHIVQDGETLFELAVRYQGDLHYNNIEQYINEVMFTNHLDSDRIHAGQTLFLPYYSE